MPMSRVPLIIAMSVACCLTFQTLLADERGVQALAVSEPGNVDIRKGNADLGRRYFLQCRACHTLNREGKNQTGPNLWGIFGRNAGTKPDFKYSPVLAQARFSWSGDTLDRFLMSPSAFLPGTLMIFRGIADDQMRLDILAYVERETTVKPGN